MRKLAVPLLVVLLLLGGCTAEGDAELSFAAQMQAFVAMGEGERAPFAFTIYFKSDAPPFKTDEVHTLSFPNASDVAVELTDVTRDETKDGYAFYVLSTDLCARAQGVFSEDTLRVTTGETTLDYPIGAWRFDVGASAPELERVDLWQSPAASSKADAFPYDYKLAEGARLVNIQIGEEIFESPSEAGDLPLLGDLPLSYVRTKVTVEQSGREYGYYGKGCLCGALDIAEEAFAEMAAYPAAVVTAQ